MEYTWSGIELKVSATMFQDGSLRLRCFASIPGVYTANAEIDVNEDKPLIASITGDASPHSNREYRLRTWTKKTTTKNVAPGLSL